MSSNKTKENLIELIAIELIDRVNKLFHSENSLIITTKSEFPLQSHNGVKITRCDLQTTFDEADYIIPHQVVTAFQECKRTSKISSADTDVFVLLCHFYKSMNMNAEVLLEDFNNNIQIISIYRTVKENISVVSSLLCAHALPGCETVPTMFGIGKGKLSKVLRKFPLTYLGNITAKEQEYIKKGILSGKMLWDEKH